MRLEKIKLSGFKSFVEPTTVLLPSNLVAVVGPNGCGKSNVIDAVRWVMGESSARLLRGETMADVIFNGSSNRKPVSQATIELVFDNSDGAIGGQYASYAEIAVKRVVSRDGQSTYHLNNVRCRRRDITNLFLGTGLGPRSYSIIEQGMISRVIEARPEDLRAFLEEAAGISKYKERRRETETRIGSTRENLDRLNDLREEVNKRLQHVQRQAATAEKYQTLRSEEQRRKGELLAVRWQTLEQERTSQAERIASLEAEVATTREQQLDLEASLEEQRERQHITSEQCNTVQGRYHTLETTIARKEQALKFQHESYNRIRRELGLVVVERTTLDAQLSETVAQLKTLDVTLSTKELELAQLIAKEDTLNQILDQAESAMQLWQLDWDSFNQQASTATQQAEVERTRIDHLEQQNSTLERRLTKLHAEIQQLDPQQLQDDIATLVALEQTQQQQALEQTELLQQATLSIQTLRTKLTEQTQTRDKARDAIQLAYNRRASLEALQQADSGDTGAAVTQWLVAHGVDKTQRIIDIIEVQPKWQQAVETILGTALNAHCVDSLEQYATAITELTTGPLQLFETGRTIESTPGDLQYQVRVPWSISSLLGNVDTAADLTEALELRYHLAPHQSVITPQGVRVGRDWLRLPGTGVLEHGMLERATELKTLETHINALTAQLNLTVAAIKQCELEIEQTEDMRDTAQTTREQLNRNIARAQSDLSGQRTSLEHLLQRRHTINADITELTNQLAQEQEITAAAHERLYTALEASEVFALQRDELIAHRDQLRSDLEQIRTNVKTAQEHTRRLNAEIETTRIRHATITSTNSQLHTQLDQNTQRATALNQALTEFTSTNDLSNELEQLEQNRLAMAKELQEAKAQLEIVEQARREGEHMRLRLEQTLRQQREGLDKLRFTDQDVLIRLRTLEEQLKDGKHDIQELIPRLSELADLKTLEAELERCTASLQRLGPINLAAIDELREETERKNYLDNQHEDISRALDVLEEAINRIDKETKTRFKATFDKVNEGLHTLFPRLFGGGQAYLELIGDNLLEAGVSVMARPPGKRNSNIHMLSGGEKALTAVALVFSIFQLNPAPFCMLDEVDAPLDDANVGRFCDLVSSMAAQVQFIFITHNKITMELAKQLIGVTMHEPGVSRLVTVDIDEAVKLAAVP